MALYVSTPVGTKLKDIEIRKSLLERTLGDYFHKGMEIWFREKDPENTSEIRETLVGALGKDYADKYFLTVQARRRKPEGNDDRFDPKNYYDLTTIAGVDNLVLNAKAAKEIGARAIVAAPWIGVFRYPEGYREKFENPEYRKLKVNQAFDAAFNIANEVGIKVALEHPTVPLYGDFNPNIEGSMFDLGFGLYEHTRQIPGDMLVMDTCHIESARNITRRLRNGNLSLVPGAMNAKIQPDLIHAIINARPFEIHYAGFKGDWDPKAIPPIPHIEGSVPGGENDVIGERIFRNLTSYFKIRGEKEDVVIVAEPNDSDFMNPVNAETTLRKIYSWVKE